MERWTVGLMLLALAAVLDSDDGIVCAQNYYVGPDGGSWHTADNWSSGHVPSSGDVVRIFDDLTVRITADVDPNLQNLMVGYVRDGTVIQDGGSISVAEGIYLGRRDGNNENMGTYVLNSGSIDAWGLSVGESDRDSTFIMNGGDLTLNSLHIAVPWSMRRWTPMFGQPLGLIKV